MSEKKDAEKVPATAINGEQVPREPSVQEVTPSKIGVQNSRDVDDALKFVQEHGLEHVAVSDEDNRRLCRIIDFKLMPMLFLTYTLNFMDKQALSFSANFGLQDNNHLDGTQYSWASGSIFYLAYLFSQPLIGRCLQWFPIGRFVSLMVLTWGILLMCTAASRSFGALMTIRFLLGAVESCINPAFLVITSQWYTRAEQPARISYWFIGNAIGQIIGGVLGYGIGHIKYGSVGSWIWYFIIFGALTFLYGIFLFFYLPNDPMTCRWLSDKDRQTAVLRVLQNRTGFVNHKWKWGQFVEALTDFQTPILFAIGLLNTIPAGGIASYGSIVIHGFGYSALNTTLLNMPQGAIQLVSLLLSGWAVSRYENTRCWMMSLSQIPSLVGSVLLYTLPDSNQNGKLAAFYILSTHTVSFSVLMAMLSANYAGFTKKMTASSLVFMGWCAGQIIAPQLYIKSEAPRYPTAFRAQFICFALLIVLPPILQAYLMWCNWRRNKAYPIAENEDQPGEDALMDATDKEQKARFRYVY